MSFVSNNPVKTKRGEEQWQQVLTTKKKQTAKSKTINVSVCSFAKISSIGSMKEERIMCTKHPCVQIPKQLIPHAWDE